jgi:hypothetical protein
MSLAFLMLIAIDYSIHRAILTPNYQIVNTSWLFNIAMQNPLQLEVSSWENHPFLWAIYTMAMLVITRGYDI